VSLVRAITSHWLVLVFLLHFFAMMFQTQVLWPLEAMLLGPLSIYASILFIPHAVRVLASWLLGPKAMFVLIPVELVITLLIFNPLETKISIVTVISPIFAASTAVIAFEFMKFMKINVYPALNTKPNWRTVVFAGILASLINSISGTLIKTASVPADDTMAIIIRYLIGDISGLLLGMLIVMLLLKKVSLGINKQS
jgi:hypothetical protein